MTNTNENFDSLNEAEVIDSVSDQSDESAEKLDSDSLREKNRQLFARAKKAELELKELRGKVKETPAEPKPSEPKGFDYGELYLEVKGVSHKEDQGWLLDMANQQGISVKDVYGRDWVQKELRERQTARSADAAVSVGTKRSPSGAALTEDMPEYWIGLDKQPPGNKPLSLRKKVLEERTKRREEQSKFAPDSLISPF